MRKAIEMFLMSDDDDDDDDAEEDTVKYAKRLINLGSGYDTRWWCLLATTRRREMEKKKVLNVVE